MRILFVGTVDFSLHCLQEVLRRGGNVVGVMTLAPERARFNADYADLRSMAEERGLPVYHIQKINDPISLELIRSIQPDVIFVFGFSQLLSGEVLSLPPLGCIGVHPALLPKHRGRHPLIWALAEGLEESGLTFFYMDQGADSGDILWQRPFSITLEDDAASLYAKIKALASEAISDFLPQLQKGAAPRIPQDNTKASYWRKRNEKDGEINWALSTLATYNLIRALTHPYVGAHTFYAGQKLIVWSAKLPQSSLPNSAMDLVPGAVFPLSGEVAIRTGDSFLRLVDWEPTDRMTLEAGTVLG